MPKKYLLDKAPANIVSNALSEAASLSESDVLTRYGTSFAGLSPEAAESSSDEHGKNIIVKSGTKSAFVRFVLSFVSPFTIVLFILALVSIVTDVIIPPSGEKNPVSAIIILVLVLSSGFFRFFQESKSSKAFEKLSNLVETTTSVTREGSTSEIPLDEVVVGDIVNLAVGDIVPADCRILSAKDLFIAQSALTGESEPVEKNPAPTLIHQSVSDLHNIAFMGTTVVSGSGVGLVVGVGNSTIFGSVASKVSTAKKEKTAFDKGVDSVSWLLVRFMLMMVPAVFLINGFTKHDWLQAFLFAISIAVGLTPEMLPMIVTSCLSKGALTMGKKKVIIKNINSIQNFGAMDVLCTDKTGTLTQDRVALEDHLNVNGVTDYRVLRHAFLNSYYETGLKNLMDKSIIERTKELAANYPALSGLDKSYVKVDEIPFDFSRKRMSVVVKDASGKTQMITKGAVENILSICDSVELDGSVLPLSDEIIAKVRRTVDDYSRKGFRIVAVAQKNNPSAIGSFGVQDEKDMVLIGYLVFFDPPKESTAKALARLSDYGVATKILTGDSEDVTRFICEKVGLKIDGLLLGKDIEAMNDSALSSAAEKANVFARLSPDDKARIVAALKRNGHVVGYMGDGINDAPALRESDIGLSVDTAVDVAKECAHVILLQKDLNVLVDGIVEGRKTYANMIKYIKMTASSNFGNIFSELAAAAFLPFLPMLPLQLLILNLIYDLSCIAIPFDNVDESYLRKPRKWDASSLGKFMLWIGPTSSVFDWVTYIVMYFVICPLFAGGEWGSASCNAVLFVSLFQTGWFVESMWTQSFVIHMIRTNGVPLIESRASWQLSLATLFAISIAVALPFTPWVGSQLSLVALPWPYFIFLALTVLLYMVLATVAKNLYRHKFGEVL
jgi:Mg2+-importing ATPase